MKISPILLLTIGALGVAMIPSSTASKPRGIRNNNPLNIEDTGESWLGKVGNDGRFMVFETAGHGLRAGARILRTYRHKYGIKTIKDILNRFAPPSENNTQNYINFVSDKTGLPEDKDLTDNDYPAVLAAMVNLENGMNPYTPEQIQEGFIWGFYG